MSETATIDRLIAERNEARENERAMSDAYVRLRVILGAMDPPTTSPAAALWAYVESVARTKADELTLLRAALAQAGAGGVPTGWICRHKSQVVDAEKAFPGQPHDYLWRYTHGTRDLAACESYGDFDVVRLYGHPSPAQREPLGDEQRTAYDRVREEFELVQKAGHRACIPSAMLNVDALLRAHGIGTTSGTKGT